MSNSTAAVTIAVIGGEGIGPEVTAEGRRILCWFAAKRSIPLILRDAEFGADAYEATGHLIPPDTREAVDASDAILFGAEGGPGIGNVPQDVRQAGGLLSLRRGFNLFANLRPIFAWPALAETSPLKARVLNGLDFIIVRELTHGIYFGRPRGIETLPDGQRRGFNTETYTTNEIRDIARMAFELARGRRRMVCSVDKANVLETSALWREEVQALHDAEFPDIELSHMYVDNCAMQIVRAPAQFDVVVTSNIFGDILSDCAAMVSGSLGMLPSASLGAANAAGRSKALYEPVHGCAPDIAGKDIANPLASILSVAMLLRLTLKRPEDAALLERAVGQVLAGGVRTADIAEPGVKPVSTREMGDAVLSALEAIGN